MRITIAVTFFCLATTLLAGPYDAPPGYYNSATGTGSTLKQQLHNIIDGHTVRSYDDARSLLQITDEDPIDPNRMILAYDRVSINVSQINPNGSIPGWDNAATWNREHTWPQSLGVGTSGPDQTDLHQLRPTHTDVNSDRGNLDFAGTFGTQTYGSYGSGNSQYWYPGDADAGMIARQQFYMAVRYDGSDGSTIDLELSNSINSNSSDSQLGDLDDLLAWHYEAPPDLFEQRRNDLIYDNYQHNRNPFVDHPEYVWSVFVDQNNDSRITVNGGTVDAHGGSVRTIDFGKVFIGQSLPTSTSVTLDKAGADGTYYSIATAGNATSSRTGGNHSFRTGGADAETISVGLAGSTSVAGLLTGTVTVDNLDVTTAGGAGRGASDGNDTINLSLNVVQHATPSWDSAMAMPIITHDFGDVFVGATNPTFPLDISNLISGGATSATTAWLDIDQVTGTGDTSRLTTDIMPTTLGNRISAGTSREFLATLNTASVGSFSAVYLVQVSDEDLPGAMSYTLTLQLFSNVISTLLGDYDLDGSLNIGDYDEWQQSFGSTTSLAADGNGNGVIDAADYIVWRDHFVQGSSSSSLAESVPEPTSAILVAACVLLALGASYHRRTGTS